MTLRQPTWEPPCGDTSMSEASRMSWVMRMLEYGLALGLLLSEAVVRKVCGVLLFFVPIQFVHTVLGGIFGVLRVVIHAFHTRSRKKRLHAKKKRRRATSASPSPSLTRSPSSNTTSFTSSILGKSAGGLGGDYTVPIAPPTPDPMKSSPPPPTDSGPQWAEDVAAGVEEEPQTMEGLAERAGVGVQTHYLRSDDGFLLCLHRIYDPLKPPPPRVGDGTSGEPVVMVHGLMMSSEVFMVRKDHNLPRRLLEAGKDPWLLNMRGNKYSANHKNLNPNSEEYWGFSLDEQVDDIHSLILHILKQTGCSTLSYVGFSQGTALGFAVLSRYPLEDRIRIFFSTASTAFVKGFPNPLVHALATAAPRALFTILGRRCLLPETLFWQHILPVELFSQLLFKAMNILLGWDQIKISESVRCSVYAHLYDRTSVRALVHWLLMVKNRQFSMYSAHNEFSAPKNTVVAPQYSLGDVGNVPVLFFSGGKDGLPDTQATLNALPSSTTRWLPVPEYEHLDFLWAEDVTERVHNPIIMALASDSPLTTPLPNFN